MPRLSLFLSRFRACTIGGIGSLAVVASASFANTPPVAVGRSLSDELRDSILALLGHPKNAFSLDDLEAAFHSHLDPSREKQAPGTTFFVGRFSGDKRLALTFGDGPQSTRAVSAGWQPEPEAAIHFAPHRSPPPGAACLPPSVLIPELGSAGWKQTVQLSIPHGITPSDLAPRVVMEAGNKTVEILFEPSGECFSGLTVYIRNQQSDPRRD